MVKVIFNESEFSYIYYLELKNGPSWENNYFTVYDLSQYPNSL